MTFPPPLIDATISATTRSKVSARASSSRRDSQTSMASRTRSRRSSALDIRPGSKALVVKGKLGGLQAHLGQARRNAMLVSGAAVEEHEAATAGSGHLPADRPRLKRLGVGLVDRRR